MDVLIRKSDGSVCKTWDGLAGKVLHPDNPLGALTMGAGKDRPLDFGAFVLVAATEEKPTPGENEKLIGPTFVIGADFTTTAVWTVEYAPPVVPTFVTPRQARLMLASIPAGEGTLLDTVNAYIAAQGGTIAVEWEYALDVQRNNPAVLAAATALGLTDEQLDQMFIEAAKL